uniref:Ig-like domain-containing protein n=1 Tax=Gopherus agassizii TaxID=38772 RepID=A0A452IRT6_9SAUR
HIDHCRNGDVSAGFACVVMAESGSTVRTFTPFYFLVEPVDTLSVRGAFIILNCSAYCEPSPKIEWKKDGTFLNLVSDDRRQLLPNGSLLINNGDGGLYRCVIESGQASARSSSPAGWGAEAQGFRPAA